MDTVATNALKNAIESVLADRTRRPDRPAPDRVVLDGRARGDAIVLTVMDTGGGVDPALLTDGGELRTGITTKPAGRGIGLGLCRQVALALGGTLRLCNHEPRGAEFSLAFPRSALLPDPTPPTRAGRA